jgi:hypothetical protein
MIPLKIVSSSRGSRRTYLEIIEYRVFPYYTNDQVL